MRYVRRQPSVATKATNRYVVSITSLFTIFRLPMSTGRPGRGSNAHDFPACYKRFFGQQTLLSPRKDLRWLSRHLVALKIVQSFLDAKARCHITLQRAKTVAPRRVNTFVRCRVYPRSSITKRSRCELKRRATVLFADALISPPASSSSFTISSQRTSQNDRAVNAKMINPNTRRLAK